MKNLLRQNIYFLLLICSITVYISGCTVIKNAPEGKPFVYKTKVELVDKNLSSDDKKNLSANLINYWADSLRVPIVTKYFVESVIESPPVLDTANITKTKSFMQNYLYSEGYYQSVFSDTIKIDSTTDRTQKRAEITIKVLVGKQIIIDSLGYQLNDTALQRIALRKKNGTKIIPHKSKFTEQAVSDELDRLIGVYRNNGYYKISKNNLIASVDTANANLLKLSLDPIEQAVKMAQAANRSKENPTASITIMKREGEDTLAVSSKPEDFVRYKIGMVNFFPETRTSEIPDSTLLHLNRFQNITHSKTGNVTIYNRTNKFVPRPMLEHLYFKRGDYYRDSAFLKTINNLNSIGAWQQVDYRNFTRGDTVDINYFLTPAIKQNITTEIQSSLNTGNLDLISTSSNMIGLGLNVSYRNRNVWKRAIQSVTSALAGIEIGIGNNATGNLIQTYQLGLSHSYTFPRFIIPFYRLNNKNLDNVRTVINLNVNYTDRRNYYDLGSFIANWGYEWRKKNMNWQYRPLNIEVYNLHKILTYDSATQTKISLLDQAIAANPYLTKAFNVGTVISQQLNYAVTFNNSKMAGMNYLRFALEESGGLLGFIPSLKDKIYRYFRIEGEYIKHFDFPKTQFAFRTFAGIGLNYASSKSDFPNTLPFFKQFIGGGPNSMRAWGLRQLGLGTNLQSDTSSIFRDRYGDMQLEMNLEYRYPMFALGSFMKVNGAIFTDIGNVWNIHKDTTLPHAEFDISRFGKALAIAVGTGIRLDFNYVVLRVDFGLKLKDPARLENGGWMSISHFTWRNDEFVKPSTPGQTQYYKYRNNYGIQLGIGMPF